MRAFLAFELSDEVVGNLVVVQKAISETRADVRLVERENLHFTVKFLGEIPDDAVEEIDLRLKDIGLGRMKIEVRGIGAFPDTRNPRIVWAGVADGEKTIVTQAAERVIEAMRGIGQEEEDRRYHAHVTLARVRSPRGKEPLQKFIENNADRSFGRIEIGALKLKSSKLTPAGPIYSDVREYGLV